MTAQELLAQLEAEDIQLTVKGDRLVLNAPAGALAPERIEEIRPHKPALMALVAERQAEQSSAVGLTRDSFDEIVEDARRFQQEGKPGPWAAFTMSGEELEGVIGGLQTELRDDLDLRIGIYRRDGLPEDQGRRIALFLLTSEQDVPLDGT